MMLRTITLGTCVSVQGTYVRSLPGGLIMVRVGETAFVGRPVAAAA